MHNKMRSVVALALLVAPIAAVQSQGQETLDIYVLDTEGGESVLYIAPTGEAMLFDTGGGDEAANARDFNRILTVVRETNISVLRLRHRVTQPP